MADEVTGLIMVACWPTTGWNVATNSSLNLTVAYPPTFVQTTTTSGPLIDNSGAIAALAFGSAPVADGTSDTGIMLYVYPLTVLPSPSEEPGPAYPPSQCQTVTVSGSFQGQLCAQAFKSDAVDGPVYSEQLTVITQQFQYEFDVTATSSSDTAVQLYNSMLSDLILH